ncbi:hypothetical protein [Roseibium aggregatum]|uniref:Uncharacterized protein n=1 Tax=Roseibium aggregatum TaxID=187304 RepID=A0A926NXB8_9HYPH|nr:hypothetical protein [Roseibium aggregatum]MBD1548134.1 hypothetical protein [Roseibium aggregatum]
MRSTSISKRLVIESVDAADVHFQWCWEFLRTPRKKLKSRQAIFDFQVRLTTAFERLCTTYRAIKAAERRLIGRKSLYSAEWFDNRMAQLAQYRNVIIEALGIGRCLGDGFAWVFYRNEPALLEQHAMHQRQLLLPPGIGGIGERAFVEKLQGFEGNFVIYHGITSILRLGDVSFYDPSSGKIACVGELKTKHMGEDQYQIALGIVAGDEKSLVIPPVDAANDEQAIPLEPGVRETLNRQVKQISAAFTNKKKSKDDVRIDMKTQFHHGILAQVVGKSETRVVRFRQAGSGLTIGAWRPRKISSLGRRLMRKTGPREKALKPVQDAALAILSNELDDNCLFVSSLGNHDSGYPPMLTGTDPFFWWPLDAHILYDIIFGYVIVMTAFNPAHLWAELRKRGFTVVVDKRSRVTTIHKEINGRQMEVKNFDYFHQAVQHGLLSEEAALEIFDTWIDNAVTAAGTQSAKYGVRLRLHLHG